MSGFISSVLGRVLAAAIAALCGWLLSKWGLFIDADTQQKAVEVLMAIVLAIYGIVHKVIDTKLNPTDAAAPDVVASDKRSVQQRRATRSL